MKYIFGPVSSRRLGLSLGVDLFKGFKLCSMNCVYCEAGKTLLLSSVRMSVADPDEVLRELLAFKEVDFEYITFSGTGEPTLSLEIEDVARGIKKLFPDKKLCLLTNATFLSPEIAKLFDLIIPSLDATDERVFGRVNRPAWGIDLETVMENIISAAAYSSAEFWIEILIVKGINDKPEHFSRIAEVVQKAAVKNANIKNIQHGKILSPITKIQIGTVSRLPAESVFSSEARTLVNIAKYIESQLDKLSDKIQPPTVEIISRIYKSQNIDKTELEKKLFEISIRRRLALSEACSTFGTSAAVIRKVVKYSPRLDLTVFDGEEFIIAVPTSDDTAPH